ncbi:uncharacterized protein EDB93DRAFT_318109 [Suillus bovinus]|uniref:uncharacterized protein n=1 Tax=Suillus bovinus TaxID=48563 RepID=UPI001B873F2E|nr:uncharacterized protein EDB93DRAFT_318109 [Suillus bovinus]KAG2151034.1 hypothetical protein EDB93DRAFT_318109 [Suillus bovinus]
MRILEEERRDAAVEEAKSEASKATSDATSLWESEKFELQKSKDEALARADAADELIEKLSQEVKILRESNDEYQFKISDLQAIRNRMNLEHLTVEGAKRKASSAASAAARSWECQKLELERARDEVIICANLVNKLLLENAFKCDEYQVKISELQSARDRDAAIIEKAGIISASPTTEGPSKLHMHAQVTAASLKPAADATPMAVKRRLLLLLLPEKLMHLTIALPLAALWEIQSLKMQLLVGAVVPSIHLCLAQGLSLVSWRTE